MKNIIRKMLLGLTFVAVFGQTLLAMTPLAEPAALVEMLKDPKIAQAFTEALQKIKDTQTADTIASNFAASGQGFVEGFQGLGLGLSRLVHECSNNFRDIGTTAAKHYWVLGGALVTGALFYMYVLPRVKFRIEFSSENNPRRNVQNDQNVPIIRIANAVA